jgi:endothelin-converting enzyme/putative endopeptidase
MPPIRRRARSLVPSLPAAFSVLIATAALIFLIAAPAAFAQAGKPAPEASAAAGVHTVPSLDLTALDRSVQPCDDFFRFACGGWVAHNPVPPERPRWGRFDELGEHNREVLHQILEKAAKPDPKRPELDRKIGDYYASCMDEAGIEAKGLAPLKPRLDRIASLKTKGDVARVLAQLHTDGLPALFRFSAQSDFKHATRNIAGVDQSGLGLPDRDYYLGEEARFVDARKKYQVHVQKMFALLGEPQEAAVRDAQTVLDLETALAKVSIDRVARRDPANRDHMMTREQLAALAPQLDWNAYFTASAAPAFTELNVGWPDFFKGLNQQLETRSVDDWKTYLRWQAVHQAAPSLPAAFVNENFDFYEKTLTGTQELRPRWKRCVEQTDRQLGEALGQRYVEVAFGPEAKARTAQMVGAIESAMHQDITELPWMTEATKKRALEKLAGVANKIGYPKDWRDYSQLKVVRGDALGNSERATAFEVARNRKKIGQTVDPMEWNMSPPTVNANYNPPQNNINFPAGILQPPFFDATMDDAVNFGGIGSVIGHELTHGFDDQGRKFDAQGNLTDWWTPEDAKEFEKRATCIADEYSGFTVSGGVHLNGRLTLGENSADNGGLRIAHMALESSLNGKTPEPRDGFTADQRFFLAYGQIWCQNSTPENEKLRAQTDPHSPGQYRVNGVVANMPEFQKAFNCATGSPMVRANACRVW